jgi:hypothetical protein
MPREALVVRRHATRLRLGLGAWDALRAPLLHAGPFGLTLCVMSKTRTEVLEESRRKGVLAGGAAAVTVVLGATIGLPVAVVAAVPSAWLGYRWWKHRAKNGIKF